METAEYTTEQNELTGMDYEPAFVLAKGFYLVGEDLKLKTKDVTKGKPGETRRVETVPISFRTIQGARDASTVSSVGIGILCVSEDGFRYPC